MHEFVHRWGLANLASIGVNGGQACQEEEMVGSWQDGPPQSGSDKGQASWGQGLGQLAGGPHPQLKWRGAIGGTVVWQGRAWG